MNVFIPNVTLSLLLWHLPHFPVFISSFLLNEETQSDGMQLFVKIFSVLFHAFHLVQVGMVTLFGKDTGIDIIRSLQP